MKSWQAWPVRALLLALSLFFAAGAFARAPKAQDDLPSIAFAQLPAEAQATLALIARNGPFPYRRDGVVFGNFEQRLPLRQRGYYREYTVPTPGVRSRGARRIISGNGGERYYTADHYRSFFAIRPPDAH